MQFLTSLFGGSENMVLNAVLALAIVLVLILLGLWMLKAFFRVSGNVGRGRNRRLAVIDSVVIDSRRQLVIVRRDNVEHVLLTGGPQDLVVETGIPVERPPVPQRRPGMAPAAAPGAARQPTTGPVQPRPAGERKPPALRHTGLLRPVARAPVIPMNPERADHPAADSATSETTDGSNGQARLGGGYYRDVIRGEGS